MKAIVMSEYGPPEVLNPSDIEQPVPKENEILVRVHATSVNYGDLLARNFRRVTRKTFNMPALLLIPAKLAFGVSKPRIRILGSEFAGEVVETGNRAKKFAVGDRVFGYLGPSMGAYAEYLCMKEGACVVQMPKNITYDEAAVLPYGAVMAAALLRKADLRPGQRVLIIGASGGIGSAAVQIARHLGAKVTGVCGGPRAEFVRALGAETVIDYVREDFALRPEKYDLIFDVLGKQSFDTCRKILTPDGMMLYASFKSRQLFQMLWTSKRRGQRVVCAFAPGSRADLVAMTGLIEQKALRAIIDKRFPLDSAVDAHRYVEDGRQRGHVVLVVSPGNSKV